MPSAQVIDLSPLPRTEQTHLEKTLSAFAEQHHRNRKEQEESDVLSSIYKQYQDDGRNLERTIMEIQSRPGLSPTARVNSINQLLGFQKHNADLQKQAREQMEKAEKKKSNQAILTDLEQRRGLTPGSLEPYVDNPAMAAAVTKEAKPTQASQPIAKDQLQRIQHVESQAEWEKATNPQRAKLLRDAGVSKENIDSVLKPLEKESENELIRGAAIAKKQAEADFAFANEQAEKIPQIQKQLTLLDDAEKLNGEGVTGNNWDLAMQKAGLLQYTSDGHRLFASYAKEAVKNANIRGIVGSQISQMEFGFFRDATISERFSQEANEKIIEKERLALRYEKLYADITENVIQENKGQIPERIQAKVNEEFAKQSKKITRELKQVANDYEAIQNVPKGYVLMFDKKRRPIHVPEDKVSLATQKGASLK